MQVFQPDERECLAGWVPSLGDCRTLRMMPIGVLQFQRRRFAEELRRRWVPRWAGLQLARIGGLLGAWRDRPTVKAAFKVRRVSCILPWIRVYDRRARRLVPHLSIKYRVGRPPQSILLILLCSCSSPTAALPDCRERPAAKMAIQVQGLFICL